MTAKQTPPADTNPPAPGTPPTSTTPPTEGGDGSTTATEQEGTEATPPWGDDFDPARAWQTIQNQRKSEAEKAKQLADAEAKVAEFEREKLTEAERVAADLEAAKTAAAAARKEVADARFEAAAVAAGIPADRLTAARAVAGDVTTSDDAGNVSIDTAVFDRLKAEHGYLFGQQAAPQPQVSFGAAAGQRQGGQGVTLTPEQIAIAQRAGMSAEDMQKYAQRTTR